MYSFSLISAGELEIFRSAAVWAVCLGHDWAKVWRKKIPSLYKPFWLFRGWSRVASWQKQGSFCETSRGVQGDPAAQRQADRRELYGGKGGTKYSQYVSSLLWWCWEQTGRFRVSHGLKQIYLDTLRHRETNFYIFSGRKRTECNTAWKSEGELSLFLGFYFLLWGRTNLLSSYTKCLVQVESVLRVIYGGGRWEEEQKNGRKVPPSCLYHIFDDIKGGIYFFLVVWICRHKQLN